MVDGFTMWLNNSCMVTLWNIFVVANIVLFRMKERENGENTFCLSIYTVQFMHKMPGLTVQTFFPPLDTLREKHETNWHFCLLLSSTCQTTVVTCAKIDSTFQTRGRTHKRTCQLWLPVSSAWGQIPFKCWLIFKDGRQTSSSSLKCSCGRLRGAEEGKKRRSKRSKWRRRRGAVQPCSEASQNTTTQMGIFQPGSWHDGLSLWRRSAEACYMPCWQQHTRLGKWKTRRSRRRWCLEECVCVRCWGVGVCDPAHCSPSTKKTSKSHTHPLVSHSS